MNTSPCCPGCTPGWIETFEIGAKVKDSSTPAWSDLLISVYLPKQEMFCFSLFKSPTSFVTLPQLVCPGFYVCLYLFVYLFLHIKLIKCWHVVFVCKYRNLSLKESESLLTKNNIHEPHLLQNSKVKENLYEEKE